MTARQPGSTGTRLREAGRLEHYFFVRARMNILSEWVVITAQYRNDAGVALDKRTLFPALAEVVYAQPALASRMMLESRASKTPVWVRLPSVDLNRVVEFRDERFEQLESILDSMYAGHPAEVPDDMPLWKLIVLRDGTVAFAYEHSIGDGQSGMAFHITLLNALRTARGLSPRDHWGVVSDFPDNVSLLPPIEKAIDVTTPFTHIVREAVKPIWPPAIREVSTAWTGLRVPDKIVCCQHVRILPHYSPDEGARLLGLSRSHKTTLTGTLHTLALLVLSRLIHAQPDGAKYKSIGTLIPVSLRPHANTPPTGICNHVSVLHNYHPLLPPGKDASADISAENFPWEVAQRLSETLRREAPRSAAGVGLLKFLGGRYEKYLLGQLGKKRESGLEVSNLGPFPANLLVEPSGPGNQWNIDKMLFAQADPTMGASIKVNVAGAPGGGVGVIVTWGKESVDMAFAEKFVAAFTSGIQGLLASR